ncbi:MAG: component of SufBCD complex [Roseobacter sp.]
MDLYTNIFELIDMRSFSNLWFWIALAVMWSTASHWVLGVPYDMVLRARRIGQQSETDLEDLVRINTNRLLFIARVSGFWILAIGCFVLTGLVLLGFVYRIEIAQALFLLGFPMSIVALISLSTARLIQNENARGAVLCKRLMRHRLYVQLTGIVSIFVTALWGMYQNLSIGVLGG